MDQPECYRGQRPEYEQDYLSVSQAGGSQQGQYQSTVSPVNMSSQQDRLNTIPSQQDRLNTIPSQQADRLNKHSLYQLQS